jgi:hypothetical protein
VRQHLLSYGMILTLTGCAGAEDGLPTTEGSELLDQQQAALGGINGLTPGLQAISADPSRRCTSAQLQPAVSALCLDPSNARVCSFINDAISVDGGTIQCSPCLDNGLQTKCIDVVERFPDGTPIEVVKSVSVGNNINTYTKNFFIAFTPDERLDVNSIANKQAKKWDKHLLNTLFAGAPVSLSTAGYLKKTGIPLFSTTMPASNFRQIRILKFDPRTGCGSCSATLTKEGTYDGPYANLRGTTGIFFLSGRGLANPTLSKNVAGGSLATAQLVRSFNLQTEQAAYDRENNYFLTSR